MNNELLELIQRAKAAWECLTPKQRAVARREHAIDWVHGEMRLGLNDDNKSGVSPLSKEEIGKIYDERHPLCAACRGEGTIPERGTCACECCAGTGVL